MDRRNIEVVSGIQMQVACPSYGELPTLRLRGGGADQKRKEARKRKFAQDVSQPQLVAETGLQCLGVDGPSEKKQKQASVLPEHDPKTDTRPVSNGETIDQSSTVQNESSKSQRLIVFIGM